jgi:predicted GH43/DUF377 family glycosyl hydrolase
LFNNANHNYISKLDRHSNDHNFTFSTITPDSVVFAPESDSDAFGTEDPRIVFRQAVSTAFTFVLDFTVEISCALDLD